MTTTATNTTTDGVPGYVETLPCEPASVRRARLLIARALNAWGVAQLTEDTTLIVSEMMTNAIDHTESRSARVMVQLQPSGVVRVEVRDSSSDTPDMSTPGSDSVRGRDLLLVDALSWRWGYDRRYCGKAVWAELRVPVGT